MNDREKELSRQIMQFLDREKEIFGEWDTHPGASTDNPSMEMPGSADSGESDGPGTGTANQLLTACLTLDELQALCENAQDLKTNLENTNLVFGTGNPHADLMLIGEAPGFHEDREGEPFVGKAGQLLNKILAAIHFRREDIYIANILKHRPPDNRDPSPEERENSLPYLKRQIELVNPKLILCLGRVSATTLLGRSDSLRNLRGTFHPFMGRELAVTYHPAALLRNPQWKRPVWEDVQRVKKRYDQFTEPPPEGSGRFSS